MGMGYMDNLLEQIKILLDVGYDDLDQLKNLKDMFSNAFQSKVDKLETQKKIEEEQILLEKKRVEEVCSLELPLNYENPFSVNEEFANIKFDLVSDAFVFSLNKLGRVDIELISTLTNKPIIEVIQKLKGSIYQNPDTWDNCFYKGFETSDEYLSGNILEKLRRAKEANAIYNVLFNDNIKVLKSLLPNSVSSDEIYATLGSPWLPDKIYHDFIKYLLNLENVRLQRLKSGKYCIQMHFEKIYDDYDQNEYPEGYVKDPHWLQMGVPSHTSYIHYPSQYTRKLNHSTYGEEAYPATKIIYKTVNNLKLFNTPDTVAYMTSVEAKQKAIIEQFQKWVFADAERKAELQQIYFEKYGTYRARKFSGKFLDFPDKNPNIKLYDYQIDAIARIIFTSSTLLSHCVGAGKTYVMVSAGMELKRMDSNTKNLYVVPNNIISQWASDFKLLYPNAKILVINPTHFTPINRPNVLSEIRNKNYDAFIIGYSSFDMIDIDDFETLGINNLFVDEAHNYKNIPLTTSRQILGINSSGSSKCSKMLLKSDSVLKSGGKLVFSTATPITNSIADIFSLMTYLQKGEMDFLSLGTFDSWTNCFAELALNFEVDVNATDYRFTQRFVGFHNLPELASIISQVADFYEVKSGSYMIENTNVENLNIKASEELKKYLLDIVNRVNAIRTTKGSRSNNMLQITTDGRKAALDVRLVSLTPTSTTKCDIASYKIYEIWDKYKSEKKTQLVFCDYSTPKANFNIYDEIRDLLINKGIPDKEIAFIHDFTTDAKRLSLFEKVNNGEIRILIGSTFKLGTGVNVQKRLIAVHHIDVPWRPSDMIQREGRMLRQGNENVEVFIYRYITEQSFDAYSWQILENKQKLISDLISNCINIRECNDIDDSVLTYSEVKALAVGNPLLKTRFEIDNELNRYYLLEKNDIESKNNARNEIAINISKLEEMKALEENLNLDLQLYIPNQAKRNKTEQNIRNELGRKIIELANENIMKDERTYIDDYLGFKIYLPEKMLDEKKYIVLEGNALHFVDVGYSNTGVMLRIDNALDGIQERITKLIEEKEKIVQRQVELNALLDVVVSYENDIKKTKNKLEKINKQLNIA